MVHKSKKQTRKIKNIAQGDSFVYLYDYVFSSLMSLTGSKNKKNGRNKKQNYYRVWKS
jgi:hypothetical protein